MFNASSGHPPQTLVMKDVPTGCESVRFVINVGGVRHETYKSTLKSLPGTRLANLASDSSGDSVHEFFFDRNSGAFAHILNYYRTGKLHCPADVCGPLFEEELVFWGISETEVEPCCWTNFRQHLDAEEALAQFEPDEKPPDYTTQGEGQRSMQSGTKVWRSKIWALFDDPHSSLAAMIVALISLLFILVSISGFCLETVYLEHVTTVANVTVEDIIEEEVIYEIVPITELVTVEIICVIWFTFEFLVRIICCPDKLKFILNVLNIIDFVAILPFYLGVCLNGLTSKTVLSFLGCLRVVRGIRILRIFKMMRHVTGIRALGHTLRASAYEFCLLAVTLSVAIFVFSALIYYVEREHEDTAFGNIFLAFWWALITMTTVGYGDLCPITSLGKVIASLCALMGVLTIVMPVPILVNNFVRYYALAEAKQRRPTKRRRCDGPETESEHK
ncbi:potassium voltage-gated channel subfamily C member 4-like isoform X2 [Clupea harengus]|uniref:Potassium voltage-gated channel subfamily C member 4-like isoform X2 n=1 Tax=Clupea harengus TaxID=7950 RepID=A0A6P8G0Y2_CLUHA|nr:potassium voltage-gated channel subfamily C member 4-like isoform X2 [Clupea harengus]